MDFKGENYLTVFQISEREGNMGTPCGNGAVTTKVLGSGELRQSDEEDDEIAN
jgi:hypothetical protein